MDTTNEDQILPVQLRPSGSAGTTCPLIEGRGDAVSYII